ncbi:MAG TPA: polyprenyl synthetase family protein [Thermomicrobiales bacterium]|nr:polyprenyl synthetase family protein [Thermomicrobiales bacterium]
MEIADVVENLHDDLARVEDRVRLAAKVEFPQLGTILQAIISSGGKRLRPLLLLLSAKSWDYDLEALIPAAAGVEMLHTASLVHDDTIDRSQLRRGQPTLNSMFDSGTVILMGDYLFAQSAILAAATMNPRVVAVFASTLADICDGQLREVFTAHRLDQSREEYERRIYGKTASLFAGSAEMGAILSGAEEEHIRILRAFGGEVGMAFQIVDDVLDLRAMSDTTGKPANLDLRQGTITLPTMLFLSDDGGGPRTAELHRVVAGDGVTDEDYLAVATMIAESGAVDAALDAAREYADHARARLASLPDQDVARQLSAFADLALDRTF